MKKLLMVIVSSLLLIALVACGDTQNEEQTDTDNAIEENEDKAETNNDTEVNEDQVETDNEDTDETKEEEELQDDQDKEEEPTNTNEEITDYEEADVIEEQIDIADMDVKIETDNPNKRILLFSDNDKVMYKTIYIKEKQRLKIINIYEDKGQIFNETI